MKIICIGRNYIDHVKELGNEVPKEPVVFMKPKSALLQANMPFYYPEFTNELHYECELVLRICKNGKYILKEHASKYYNAFSLGIDFTARDLQDELKAKGLPWEKAKAFDNSAVVGAFTEIKNGSDLNKLKFHLLKNEEKVQTGDTSKLIFGFNHIVEHISQFFTLNIGDLIFTGTPAGVGECSVGDVLEAFIGDTSTLKVEVK